MPIGVPRFRSTPIFYTTNSYHNAARFGAIDPIS